MPTSTDRYKKFARDWKSIRMVSKMKWPWRAKGEEVNTLITSMMVDRFGDKALDVIADAYYQIGLKDGDKIITKLRITGKDSTACLSVIEALSVLAGVNSEFKEKDKGEKGEGEGEKEGGATLCLMNCPFTDTLRFFHPLVCAKYTQGLVEGVNEKAKVKLVKGLCGGDDYCEFEITIG
jgi:predicted ArsR family transcriptional regulator